MKRILSAISILTCAALLNACALVTPATETKVEVALDTIAAAIRHAEGASMTPAQFNAFLETYVALLPAAAPYIKDTELAYLVLYNGGNLTAGAIEALAARYDS